MVKKLINFLYILKIFYKQILLRYLLFCKKKKKKKKKKKRLGPQSTVIKIYYYGYLHTIWFHYKVLV